MKRRRYRMFACVMAGILFVMASWTVKAYASDARIVSTIVYEDSVYIYIRGISGIQSDSVIQIGNMVCPSEQVMVAELADLSFALRTLVLVDNSNSIPGKNHADIQEILKGLTTASMENEQIQIGTFSDEITYLCDPTNDQDILETAIEGIAYQDQDTCLSNILHDVIEELGKEQTPACTRILVISDGADDKTIGYTSDEVRDLIRKSGVLIYAIGIPAKKNAAELETMFSFSRASNADFFLLDGTISNAAVVDVLLQDQKGVCLKITLDECLKDGSSKGILLKLNTAGGMVELTASADMPFGSGMQGGVEPGTKTPQDISLPVLIPDLEQEDTEQPETSFYVFLGGAAVLLAVSVAVGVFALNRRKRETEISANGNDPEMKDEEDKQIVKTEYYGETVIDPRKEADVNGLWDSSKYELVLKNLDVENLEYSKRMEGTLRIGRHEGQDIVIRDSRVSQVHCEVALREDTLYLKDCGSKNGTYYKGVKVHREIPIDNGGEIVIGKYHYSVKLVKML